MDSVQYIPIAQGMVVIRADEDRTPLCDISGLKGPLLLVLGSLRWEDEPSFRGEYYEIREVRATMIEEELLESLLGKGMRVILPTESDLEEGILFDDKKTLVASQRPYYRWYPGGWNHVIFKVDGECFPPPGKHLYSYWSDEFGFFDEDCLSQTHYIFDPSPIALEDLPKRGKVQMLGPGVTDEIRDVLRLRERGRVTEALMSSLQPRLGSKSSVRKLGPSLIRCVVEMM